MSKGRLFLWWLGALTAYVAGYGAYSGATAAGLPHSMAPVVGGIAFVGVIVVLLLVRRWWSRRGSSVSVSVVDRDNQGDYERAAWISRFDQAAGVHWHDKLTPDGLLCGYQGDDFGSPFQTVYAVDIGVDAATSLLDRVEGMLADAPAAWINPLVDDGFQMRLRHKRRASSREVRFSNIHHADFFALFEKIWALAPPEAADPMQHRLPDVGEWTPSHDSEHVIVR